MATGIEAYYGEGQDALQEVSGECFSFLCLDDHALLAMMDHEPLSLSPPGISQSDNVGFGQDSQLLCTQASDNIRINDVPSPGSQEHPKTNSSSPCSLPSYDPSTPSSHDLSSDDFPNTFRDGKMRLPLKRTTFNCSYCTSIFTNESQYRRHILRHQSEARQATRCDACKLSFTTSKDLKRHQTSACSSASKKQFVCECGKTYPRKDSLLRHFRHSNKNPNDNTHRPKKLDG